MDKNTSPHIDTTCMLDIEANEIFNTTWLHTYFVVTIRSCIVSWSYHFQVCQFGQNKTKIKNQSVFMHKTKEYQGRERQRERKKNNSLKICMAKVEVQMNMNSREEKSSSSNNGRSQRHSFNFQTHTHMAHGASSTRKPINICIGTCAVHHFYFIVKLMAWHLVWIFSFNTYVCNPCAHWGHDVRHNSLHWNDMRNAFHWKMHFTKIPFGFDFWSLLLLLHSRHIYSTQ